MVTCEKDGGDGVTPQSKRDLLCAVHGRSPKARQADRSQLHIPPMNGVQNVQAVWQRLSCPWSRNAANAIDVQLIINAALGIVYRSDSQGLSGIWERHLQSCNIVQCGDESSIVVAPPDH